MDTGDPGARPGRGDSGVTSILVDRDGQWTWNGQPMVHERILPFLKRRLRRDPDGRYWVRLQGAQVPVQVEDAPFVVLGIDGGDPPRLRLDDGVVERVTEPLTLLVGPGHRLYMPVRRGRHRAVLSRAAHQQVWQSLEITEDESAWLRLGDRRVRVDIRTAG
jgi:hypothetical protein